MQVNILFKNIDVFIQPLKYWNRRVDVLKSKPLHARMFSVTTMSFGFLYQLLMGKRYHSQWTFTFLKTAVKTREQCTISLQN